MRQLAADRPKVAKTFTLKRPSLDGRRITGIEIGGDVRAKPDGYAELQPWQQVPALQEGEVFGLGLVVDMFLKPIGIGIGNIMRRCAMCWCFGASS